MSCYAQGRCRFCCKRHTLPVFGNDETAHMNVQKLNLKLVVLNTVCSSCIIRIEDFLKKFDSHFEEIIIKDIHGTVIENTQRNPKKLIIDQTISNNNAKIQRKSQVHNNFQTYDINNPNKIDVNTATTSNVRMKETAKIGSKDNENLDSIEHTQYETCVNINNSEILSEQNQSIGRTKRKIRQLTCDFCRKEFNHAGDLNKHRRTHTGEQPYTCNKCQQKFSHASNLTRHQRVHSGERPFLCRTCGRTFNRKDKFTAHLTAEHYVTKL